MKETQLRNIVRQEIVNKLDKLQTEGEDPFVPTYGKGDVVHDCPKHVQETKTGLYGKVTGHTLNEAGDVNFVDVDFGTGKVFKNIPTKKLKVIQENHHVHETNPEPITGAGEEDVVSEDGTKCDCAQAHPGISHKAYDSQQLAEDIKVLTRKPNEQGSSLGYRLTKKQHTKMLAFLKKNNSNADVKQLISTLKDKYSDSVGITIDGKSFFVYGNYGSLRIGTGGKVSQWSDASSAALTKYIGEAVLLEAVTSRQVTKAFSDISKLSMEMLENLEKYKAAKKSGNEADIKKYVKVAGTLSVKKRKAEADMEKMITQLDKDVELVEENRLTEGKSVKTIKDLENSVHGTKVSGGGYGPWKKTTSNNWKNLKTNNNLHNQALFNQLQGFSDFIIEGKITEAKDQKLAKLFQISKTINVKAGEDKLYKLSQDWESWNVDNDDKYDDLVDHLFMAVELVQDAGEPGKNNVVKDKEYYSYIKSAESHLKQFRTGVVKAMRLHTEGTLTEAPMDNRFSKEWEKNCKVLTTHIQHELRKKHEGHRIVALKKFAKDIARVSSIPEQMSKFVGMNERALKSTKPRLTEAFASRKLGQVFGAVNRYTAEKSFLVNMAKSFNLEWDKITDDQVKGPDTKLDRKGIDLIIATKDVTLPATSTYDWRTQIKKGQLLSATIKGKRVWSGRGSKISTGGGKDRRFVGLDKRGYSNVKSILSIDGAVVYHIDPELKSRGAGEKQASRAEAKAGAAALMSARDTAQQNRNRYEAALKVRVGAEGKGSLIKMIETATKLYEKVLKEKLSMLKKGMVSTESWNNDSWQLVSRAHEQMVREFQYWMKEAADQEAQAKKGSDKFDSTGYIQKQMNQYALNIKQQFNKMNTALKKIDKSKEYSKVQGRAY